MSMQLVKPCFYGEIYTPSAVSVRGDDGLFQYGIVVGRQGDQLLIDFLCGGDTIVTLPADRVYHLAKAAGLEIPAQASSNQTALPAELQNKPVEILIRLTADEPWKWRPGLLYSVLWINGHGYVSVRVVLSDSVTVLACVRIKQIRTPSTETQISLLAVRNIVDVTVPPHRPAVSDPQINHLLPRDLLAVTLGYLDSRAQLKVRRVCTLWRDSMAQNCTPSHVQLRMRDAPTSHLGGHLYTVLNQPAKILSLIGPRFRSSDCRAPSGTKSQSLPEVVSSLGSVFDACGFPRPDTVVLSGLTMEVVFFHPVQLRQWPRIVLKSFGPLCRSLVLHNALLVVAIDVIPAPLQPLATPYTRPSFTIPIKKLRLDVNTTASAEQLWTQTDCRELDGLAGNVTAHLKQHNETCECLRRVLWVLNNMQRPDPDGTPEYRGKRWTAIDLAALDAEKLTAITLRALNACL